MEVLANHHLYFQQVNSNILMPQANAHLQAVEKIEVENGTKTIFQIGINLHLLRYCQPLDLGVVQDQDQKVILEIEHQNFLHFWMKILSVHLREIVATSTTPNLDPVKLLSLVLFPALHLPVLAATVYLATTGNRVIMGKKSLKLHHPKVVHHL